MISVCIEAATRRRLNGSPTSPKFLARPAGTLPLRHIDSTGPSDSSEATLSPTSPDARSARLRKIAKPSFTHCRPDLGPACKGFRLGLPITAAPIPGGTTDETPCDLADRFYDVPWNFGHSQSLSFNVVRVLSVRPRQPTRPGWPSDFTRIRS